MAGSCELHKLVEIWFDLAYWRTGLKALDEFNHLTRDRFIAVNGLRAQLEVISSTIDLSHVVLLLMSLSKLLQHNLLQHEVRKSSFAPIVRINIPHYVRHRKI
jgi:hypothetical protein